MTAENKSPAAPFTKYLPQYRTQLRQGHLQEAYSGLMQYFDQLKHYLTQRHSDYFVSSSIRPGNMDYTYFYFFPKPFKRQGLKIVILFIHDAFRFEVWLAGYNKTIRTKYLRFFKENGWNKYTLPSSGDGDSILEHVLVEEADFTDLDALTRKVEAGTLQFIADIEAFLLKYPLATEK
jgi:hypothetical protein